METIQFILSDESINSHGFRVLTDGIRIDRFLKNPVMFYSHQRSSDAGALLPIGRWQNVQKIDQKLIGEAVFDMNDAFARSVEQKVRNRFINAASIAIDPLELSEDSSLMMHGQKLPTITVSELIEISIADIPSNANAVRLTHNKKAILPSELKLAVDSSLTEYERLRKSNVGFGSKATTQLAILKERDPMRFKMLQEEYLQKIRIQRRLF